ncbi:MAG TPA: hypothetical protein VGO58_11855 [Chitinophagaceae bacterium]|jgi:photosystem II stability/assembly factor-like uncharacterized protein|nr:hypothetical protein [Chitinophagaceae bacterium]
MKKNLILFCLPLFIMSAGEYPCKTADKQWQLSGLDTTTVFGMTVHNGHLYAGTRGNGIYRLSNNGQSWSPVNTGLTNLFVRSLLSAGTTLFAGTKNGVFLSADNGTTWISGNTGIAEGITVFSLLSVNDHLYAGASSGVYHSTNGGASWTLQSNGFAGMPYVYALAWQAPNIFAGTQENSIMKSGDNGLTWTRSNTGIPPGMTISSLHVFNTTSLMCGTDGAGCFLSNDQGANWKMINNGITSDRFFGLTACNKVIYGGALNTVFKSADNGLSWTALPVAGLPPNVSVNSILVYNKKIFISTDTGIYSYEDIE